MLCATSFAVLIPIIMLLFLFRYTYEVSPVFLLVEEAVIKKMIEFIGWEEGDGIFNPGRNSSDLKLSHYKLPNSINSINTGVMWNI